MRFLIIPILFLNLSLVGSAQVTPELEKLVQTVLGLKEIELNSPSSSCNGQLIMDWKNNGEQLSGWDSLNLSFKDHALAKSDSLSRRNVTCGSIGLITENKGRHYSVVGNIIIPVDDARSGMARMLRFKVRLKQNDSGFKVTKVKTENILRSGCWIWL